MEDKIEICIVFIVLIVGFFAGAKVVDTIGSNNTETHDEIMQHNCAEYDSKTGEFKWIK